MAKKIIIFILVVISFIMIYPILFIEIGSFMSKTELTMYLEPALEQTNGYATFSFLPQMPTLRNIFELLLDTPEFFVMFWNSIKMTGSIIVGQLFVGVPMAWALAKHNFPLKNAIIKLYIILMMLPFQVTLLSNYLVLDEFELIDTHLAIILPATFSTFPIFIMYRFFSSIPDSIIEAAKIDGASEVRILWHFGIPLGSGGIISALVLGFLEYWNMIEQPLAFIKSKELWPLSLYLPDVGVENIGIAFTVSNFTLIPALLVFLCGQDYIEQGIVATAIKE